MLTDLFARLNKVDTKQKDPRFYFVWHERLFNLLLFLFLLNILMWAGVYYFACTQPDPSLWAQTANGKIIRLSSVDEPKYTNTAIQEWSENAIKIAYNYDFSRYQEQQVAAKPYFSPEAWDLFSEALEKNVFPTMKKNQLQVSAAVDQARVVKNETSSGVATWLVYIPAKISYISASESSTKNVTFKILVKKQITYTNPKGLYIVSLEELQNSK